MFIKAGIITLSTATAWAVVPEYPKVETSPVYTTSDQNAILENHEARISNTEKDVTDLQANTNTPPSSDRVEVPPPPAVVVQQTEQATQIPEPEPVVVTAYEVINIEGSEDQDCKLTYSDGTTHQWHWKTVEYNQSTKTTNAIGKCDGSIVGKEKSTTSSTGYVS